MSFVTECHTVTLANGLRVVIVPQPWLHRAHVALWARVGSRFETRDDNGISHFLEHMIYRGTQRVRSAHAVNLAFERLGGSLFASTQVDHGIFSLALPPESLDEACALFGEVLSQPAFLDIDIERGIVLEEILEDLDDEGRQVDADNLSRALIYGSHPLGFTITGGEAHVRAFDEPTLRRHHAHHYTTDNAVLAFSGAVDEAQALRIAERDFGGLPRAGRIRDGMSTRLYHRLCDARGLCYDVSAGYDGYEDDGVVDVAAGVQHKRAALVTREVLAMFEELAREGPTSEELDKARRRIAWDARAIYDSAEETAAFYAGGLLFERPSTPEEHMAQLIRVAGGEVREAAQRLARPERLNVVAVGLLDEGEDTRLEEAVKGWAGAG